MSEGFKEWYEQFWISSNFICKYTEKHLMSNKLKFHGTVDAILQDKYTKHLFVTDWKFSNSDDPMRAFQLAGYALLAEEELKVKINKGLIVRIEFKKNPQKVTTPRLTTPWFYTNLRPYKAMFKALVKDYYKTKTI